MEIFGIKVDAITRLIRELVVTIFVAVVAYKVIGLDIKFDFTKLSATDLVALLLAVFSVGLSAAFFFAATGSSSKFYDNMHKFTKDTSVILGQLTERLQNLDKSQHEVKERFDRLYANGSSDSSEISEKEKEKESKVNEDREDLKNTIESWLSKYQIDNAEKEKFKAELSKREKQLSESLGELSELKSEQRSVVIRRVKKHIGFIVRKTIQNDILDFDLVVEKILRNGVESPFKNDLVSAGFINDPSASNISDLTEQGMSTIGEIYERYSDN